MRGSARIGNRFRKQTHGGSRRRQGVPLAPRAHAEFANNKVTSKKRNYIHAIFDQWVLWWHDAQEQLVCKSQSKKNWKPGKDTSEDAFKEWTAKLYHALKPILWKVCSDRCTMFEMEYSDHGNGLRDFKWKWRYDSEDKREEDAKGRAATKRDADTDGQELPAKKPKKDKSQTRKKQSKEK